jgi:hypothetical protein
VLIAVLPASGKDSGMPHKWKVVATWGGASLMLALLGWVLVSVMDVAERPAMVADPAVQKSISTNDEKQPEVIQSKVDANVAEKAKKALQTTALKEVKPVMVVKKTIQPKKTIKPKKIRKVKPAGRSITYSVGYKVTRSDGGAVDVSKPHEFKGGKRLYFESLRSYRGKELFTSYKKAQVRLYLDKPVTLRKIVLHKASVGRLNFKGGYVKLAVQDSKHKWHEIFSRKDDDVDIAVTISKSKLPKEIRGVRLRFRTPEPITIGPIDLIR